MPFPTSFETSRRITAVPRSGLTAEAVVDWFERSLAASGVDVTREGPTSLEFKAPIRLDYGGPRHLNVSLLRSGSVYATLGPSGVHVTASAELSRIPMIFYSCLAAAAGAFVGQAAGAADDFSPGLFFSAVGLCVPYLLAWMLWLSYAHETVDDIRRHFGGVRLTSACS